MIERPPRIYRRLFPGAVWQLPGEGRKRAYLTFDDGPVAEVTPAVLDILGARGVKATFFQVGDNVRRNPELAERILREGHSVGNHTMHHLQGVKVTNEEYFADIRRAASYIPGPLFRPPHGLLRRSQLAKLQEDHTVVMYDLITRDYSPDVTADRIVENVMKYARDGSIIVFHDSLKTVGKIETALPRAIEWLLQNDYELRPIPMSR